MSKLIAVRIDDRVLRDVDRARRRSKTPRAKIIHEALEEWLARQREKELVRRDQEGYARMPVGVDEFEPLLSAQAWPK